MLYLQRKHLDKDFFRFLYDRMATFHLCLNRAALQWDALEEPHTYTMPSIRKRGLRPSTTGLWRRRNTFPWDHQTPWDKLDWRCSTEHCWKEFDVPQDDFGIQWRSTAHFSLGGTGVMNLHWRPLEWDPLNTSVWDDLEWWSTVEHWWKEFEVLLERDECK